MNAEPQSRDSFDTSQYTFDFGDDHPGGEPRPPHPALSASAEDELAEVWRYISKH